MTFRFITDCMISDKDTVGYYDMDSKVTVTDAKME